MITGDELAAHIITIRQYYAGRAKVDFGEWETKTICEALDLQMPDQNDRAECFLFWAKAEAKMKVIKADYLIAELNKQS